MKIQTPKLRFPEFGSKWSAKKLSALAKFIKGRGISKQDLKDRGECLCQDLLKKKRMVISVCGQRL